MWPSGPGIIGVFFNRYFQLIKLFSNWREIPESFNSKEFSVFYRHQNLITGKIFIKTLCKKKSHFCFTNW